MEREGCFDLLKSWCDGLIRYQIREQKDPRFYGGFCPACKMIHGRSSDAVYPLMCTADFTGQKKNIRMQQKLFLSWGSNMVCDDGAFITMLKVEWNGITVFGVISLCEALKYHGQSVGFRYQKKWEQLDGDGASGLRRQ